MAIQWDGGWTGVMGRPMGLGEKNPYRALGDQSLARAGNSVRKWGEGYRFE